MPTLKINGMHCEHCRKSVTEAVQKTPGIAEVNVDLASGILRWTDADPSAPVDPEAVKRLVGSIGFEAKDDGS
jgi:copper chaperone CopZ